MGKGQRILQRLADGADLSAEIAGDRRVLIENHFGVKEYSREKIGVKVKYGLVCVCGCDLELIRMTKEQLIISGRIDAVTLIRRG